MLDGPLLDAIALDPSRLLEATETQTSLVLRVVRDAVELRARAVGSRTGAR